MMFNDDVSEVNASWCNVLTSSDTLVSYSGNRRSDYALSGGRWIKWRTQTSAYNYDISNYTCIDISKLNSAAALDPFFYLVAFVLFVSTILLFRWSVRGIIGRF